MLQGEEVSQEVEERGQLAAQQAPVRGVAVHPVLIINTILI